MHCTSITSCHECITPKEWNYPNITRPFSILYYALGGSAFYSMNGVERPFEPGHLYILPANRVFSLREDPDNKFYSVYIHAYTSPEIHSVMDVDENQDAFLKDVLQLVRKYAKGQSQLHRVYIKNLTELILSHVFETMTDTQERMHVKIKNHIEANYLAVFHQGDLSAQLNYSNSYLTKLFREKYNLTPKQYAKQLVMKEAALLLGQGKPVHAVAEQLAFSSPENFSRFFKSCYGYCPSQYIKRFKHFPD